MEIVGHHDRGEALGAERPGRAFEIRLHEARARNTLWLTVHCEHLEAALGEEHRMAPGAARDIEHRPAFNQRRPTAHPIRRQVGIDVHRQLFYWRRAECFGCGSFAAAFGEWAALRSSFGASAMRTST